MPAKKKIAAKKVPKKKVAAKKPHGRPTSFTSELAAQICERISSGEPLAFICRDPGMPATRTISDWKADHPEFSADFASARARGFDAISEQCLEISDDERHDWAMSQKGTVTNEVAIGRARLRVDTRLKLLAKWDPSRYGERLAITQTTKVEPMSREDMIAEMRQSPAFRAEIQSMLDEASREL